MNNNKHNCKSMKKWPPRQEWRRDPTYKPWQAVTTVDPNLERLLHQVIERYTNEQFVQICQHVHQQRMHGDMEYDQSPKLYTLARRILMGEYDYLFN